VTGPVREYGTGRYSTQEPSARPYLKKDEFSQYLHTPFVYDRPHGRAIAQEISRRLPTAAARFRAQVRSCRICGGQIGTGAGLLRVLRFSLQILISPTAPHSSSSIIRGWYNRPISGRSTKWTQSHPTPRHYDRPHYYPPVYACASWVVLPFRYTEVNLHRSNIASIYLSLFSGGAWVLFLWSISTFCIYYYQSRSKTNIPLSVSSPHKLQFTYHGCKNLTLKTLHRTADCPAV
jgi:hypothetical protein